MKKDEVIRKIKERKWTVASTPAHLMTCHPWMAGFMRMRKFFPKYCSEMWLFIKDAIGFQVFDEGENYANLKQLYDDPKRVRTVMRVWRKLRDTFLRHRHDSLTNPSERLVRLSSEKLAKEFFVFLDEFSDVWAAPLAVDNMAIYTEGELLKSFTDTLLKKEKPHAHEYFSAISQPSDASFVTREHISLLSLARLRKKGKNVEFEKCLTKHQKNFYWTANSYKVIKELSVGHFRDKALAESAKSDDELIAEIKRLKDMPVSVEKNRKKLLRQLRLPKKLVEKITLTPLLGVWLDERKEVNLRGNHVLVLYLKEIAKRFGYSLEEVYYFTPPEIKKLLTEDAGVPKAELAERRQRLIYIVAQPFKRFDSDVLENIRTSKEDEDITLFSGEKARKLIELFESTTMIKKEENLVRGVVACRGSGGKVSGRVRVILDPEGADFKEGEILLSTMTRAEYVPFMRRAAAIVTDEGGITCHAAVVSRELDVPCVIGAKRATKVFKDGDIVEIDVLAGTVKIRT